MADDSAIRIAGISKHFGDAVALHEVSLTIRNNEFFTLLGPSGCGKTTMLRILAGFEQPSKGEIFLFGEEIEQLPPHRRPINTVFQSYALFPHMTVMENVMFGLRMLNTPAADAAQRAAAMLEMVKLSEFSAKHPAQLSGGQRQRVALARALAPSPRVLLLDESLSALDLKLRQAMRVELKQIQRETGITFVFVTHDQDEAMTMSDRIAVMSRGEVQQVGTPREIYDTPRNRFVADFIGDVNLLRGQLENTADGAFCILDGNHRVQVDGVDFAEFANTAQAEGEQTIAIRPEKVQVLAAAEAEEGAMRGVVERSIYIGATTETHIRLHGGPLLIVRAPNAAAAYSPPVGSEVGLQVEAAAARLLRD